jgi:hypothetical protein
MYILPDVDGIRFQVITAKSSAVFGDCEFGNAPALIRGSGANARHAKLACLSKMPALQDIRASTRWQDTSHFSMHPL